MFQSSSRFEAIVQAQSGPQERSFSVHRMYNLGSATRDPAVAVAHQEEVAREGITIAYHVPAPRIYPMDASCLVTRDNIGVYHPRTSGEVEIVLVQSDRLYVGVGSDHSDRYLETASIAWSKQANANVLAPVLWDFEEIADHWDRCTMRSKVDGHAYQEVSVSAFLSPPEILRILRERVSALPQRDFVVFCGTIVALDKKFGFGKQWQFEMEDPVLGRTISHSYRVENLFDEIEPAFRVPLVTGAL